MTYYKIKVKTLIGVSSGTRRRC